MARTYRRTSWRKTTSLMAISVGIFGLTPNAVLAQTSDAAETADNPAEIVVTARKREEKAQDVPISMTVLTGGQLVSQGVRELQDLMQHAPDFQQSNGAIGGFRTMRGAGSVGSNFSFEQSVGLFFDEVSFGRNPQGRLPIFDVERAEVLRGPQVLSFGNSTTAGAVSIVTKKPGHHLSADLTSSYEFNQKQFILKGGATLPLGDNVSVRVSGVTDQLSKGWVAARTPTSVSYDPRNNINAGRIILKADPAPNISMTLKYEHDDVRYDGSNMITTTNRNNFPFIPSIVFGTDTYRGPAAPFNVTPAIRMKNDTYQGTLEFKLGGLTLTSNTAYWHYKFSQFEDAETTSAPIAISNPRDNFKQFSQELRLSGTIGERIEFITGLYYQHDDEFGEFILSGNRAALGIANPPPAFARVSGVDQTARTWSGFVDLTIRLAEGLTINPGIRYTDIERNGRQFAYGSEILSDVPTNAYDAYLAPVFGAVTHNFQLSAPEHHAMPQLIITYEPHSDLTVFAKFVQGAKTGGFDFNYVANDPTQAQFRAEKVTDYELGIKGALLDRTLQFSLTAFNAKYRDLQLSVFSVNRFVVSNAGGQRSQGLEFDFDWRTAIQGLTLNGSLTYLDAKYTDFKGASCTLDQALSRPAPCTQDLTGARSGFSSKWYASLGAAYEQDIGAYRLALAVDGNFRSSYRPSTNNDPISLQGPQLLLNARAQFGPADGPWHLAVFGRNLTNELYSNFWSPNGAALTPGVSVASVERTRQIGVEFGFHF